MRENRTLDVYKGKKILVTGHTGFKGTWLTTWLNVLGAEVTGCSLPALSGSLNTLDSFNECVSEKFLDIRDKKGIVEFISNSDEFDLVFHLAAQPIVLDAYLDPLETFEINSLGAANVVYAAMNNPSCAGIVVATTDKVYRPSNASRGHSEGDPLGGLDPYSASKSAAEMLLAGLRITSENNEFPIVSVRAGNVIGGGDNGKHRLIPDIVRGILNSEEIVIRNPNYVRPWMHVLDVLNGYLLVGAKILTNNEVSNAFNFGPNPGELLTVLEVAEQALESWGSGELGILQGIMPKKVEDAYLVLNSNLAKEELGWLPKFDTRQAVDSTIQWWKSTSDLFSPLEAILMDIHKY